MQETWEDDSPIARFWGRLVRERALEFMKSKAYLKKLRYNYEQAKSDQKLFGTIWEEYGTNVFQLIAEAYGETWDAEDEEKRTFDCSVKKEVAVNQREDVPDADLVGTREESARERIDELQGKPEAGVRVLEEDEGRARQGSCAEEEEAPKESKGRREDFYRRAGGCSR